MESVLLDIVLLGVLVGYAVFGYLNGFFHALLGFVGADAATLSARMAADADRPRTGERRPALEAAP